MPVLRYRQLDARFKLDASAGVRIKRYRDYTAANSEDADARLKWSLPRENGATTGADLNLSYFESSDAVLEVNQRVHSQSFEAAAGGEVLVTRRNLLSAGFNYGDTQRDFGSDQRSRSGRVGYSFVGFTNGTVVSLGYRRQRSTSTDSFSGAGLLDQTAQTATATISHPLYAEAAVALTYGHRWLDRGAMERALNLPDSDGSFVGLSLNGPFLPRQYFPKTTGTFHLAYEQAEIPGINDRNRQRLVGQLDVTWQARERTGVTLAARRTQQLSLTDHTIVNLGGSVTVRQAIGNFLTADLELGYNEADFIGLGRTDDRYEGRLSGRYALNRAWSARLSYLYLDSRSNLPLATFERHIVELTLTHVF